MGKCSVCFVSAVFVCQAFADFTAHDYVQDGLEVQFDAIDNAGTGVHNPTATEWVNLKGGTSFTLKDAGSWSGGKALYCDGTGLAASSSEAYKYGRTFEYCFKRSEDTGKAVIFYGGQSGAYGPYAGLCGSTGKGFAYSHCKGTAIPVGTFASASCVYNINEETGIPTGGNTMYLNGVSSTSGAGQDNINAGGSTSLIGGRSHSTAPWPYIGDVYSIRIYSRKLTSVETILNSCIDRVRFNGENPEDVFAEFDGYSYSDGKIRVRTRVFTGGGGTVSIDGGDAVSDTTFQAAYMNLVTLLAVPADGYKFEGWVGPGVIGDSTSLQVQIPANQLAEYEAVFIPDGGEAWWTTDTLTWENNSSEEILWNSHPSNWVGTASGAHRYPVDGDTLRFTDGYAYNVLFDRNFSFPTLLLDGGAAGVDNIVRIGNGVTWSISGNFKIAPENSTARRRRKVIIDGAVVNTKNLTLNQSGTSESELIITNNARITIAEAFVSASSSSGGYYGGTGIVTVADGRLEATKSNYATIALCNGQYTENDSYTKHSYSKMYIGKKGSARFSFLSIGRNADVFIDGGVIEFQGAAAQRSTSSFIMNCNTSGRQTFRIKDGVFKLPVQPTGTGHYGNERLSRIEFIGSGQMSFIQEGGVVTNCGIWFKQSSGNVPPRYEVSGDAEMYMIAANHNGDIAANSDYANGLTANGLAAWHTAANSGTFSIRGGKVKASIPRVNTIVSTGGASDNGASGKTYSSTEYRPHIETVITTTGASAIELRDSTEVHGMHTVIPEGGMQIVTTNRFPVWRHASGLSLTRPDETYYRVPNADLWTAGIFADRPDEWGVLLNDSAKITPEMSSGEGTAVGWVDLPKWGTNSLKRAFVYLNVSVQDGFTLEEIVADMVKAGYHAEISEGDYNVAVNLMPTLGAYSCERKLIFDFNKVQSAIDVRDSVLVPKALVTDVKVEYQTHGFIILVR